MLIAGFSGKTHNYLLGTRLVDFRLLNFARVLLSFDLSAIFNDLSENVWVAYELNHRIWLIIAFLDLMVDRGTWAKVSDRSSHHDHIHLWRELMYFFSKLSSGG